MTTEITISAVCARWRSAERPLFKGQLIDDDCSVCAQGDILRMAGWSDAELRSVEQEKADAEVAKVLGISRAHTVLLRRVNDSADGCPQDVLDHPEKILGPEAKRILKFWLRLDAMKADDWRSVNAARDAAGDAAWDAARVAAWAAARDAAGDAARVAARVAAWAAAWASNEIQGHTKLDKFFFLPLFGINSLAELE